MYRAGAAWGAFESSPLMDLRPGLEGVAVVARIVPRQEYALPLGEVKAFWQRWFQDTGAEYGSVT